MPLNARAYIDLGRELRKRPFKVRLLVLWAFAVFWIVFGVTFEEYWAIALGVVFVVLPFVSLMQQRRQTDH